MVQDTVTLEDVSRALARPLSGESTDYDLNPDVKRALGDAPYPLRPAAVLCALVERDHGLSVLLTRRSSALKHHPGQIAFPGGKVDAMDDGPMAAALREAEEEIGLPRSDVTVLGRFEPHETVTRFSVTPFVAHINRPFSPKLETDEVEELFEVPLDFLMDRRNYHIRWRVWAGHRREYYTIPYGPYYIWGATARMLRGLSLRVRP